MMIKRILLAGKLLLLLFPCFLFSSSFSQTLPLLKTGIWRSALQREDGKKIVFNFELKDNDQKPVLYVFNAKERLKVDSFVFHGDSLLIQMPFFGSHFNLKIVNDKTLVGEWVKDYGSYQERMPFKANWGDRTRMVAFEKPNANISGSWETFFSNSHGGYKAIGLFHQKENQITGTFLTPSGDFRYLQGVVSGDTLKLSGFDGCHAMLFTAIINAQSNQLVEGQLYSINSKVSDWHSQKKVYKTLPKAYAVSNFPAGKIKLHFKLKDMRTGKTISLNEKKYKGKVIVLQLLGSWCPNCMDETRYLTAYFNKGYHPDVSFIGIDFERTANFEPSQKALNSFFDQFKIQYPVVFSGVAASDPNLTQKVFPELPTKIHAFPTTIFIGKMGFVRKIHSGFNGPATGKYYEASKNEFSEIINSLLAE